MGELSKLPNIGATLEAQLVQVGISNIEELRATGARKAWLMIQKIDESACVNRLMALEGAIRGVKKMELPDDVKTDLKQFYREHKISGTK